MNGLTLTRRRTRWYQSPRSRRKGLIALAFFAPGFIYYLLFRYMPMWGNVIAFQDYNPFKGVMASKWVGFKHFITFFQSNNCWRLMRNTLMISVYSILFGFPVPIVFAILQNEVRFARFRSVVQSISYFPHFISVVIICGLLKSYLSVSDGIINLLIEKLGIARINFMQEPGCFRSIYVGSGIWQGMGWSSIIYYATLTSIDTTLYEAAEIDGANRWQRIWHISVPSLIPTMMTLLLMQLGNVMNVGFEKVLLLQNTSTYSTSDLLSTYVYRMGIEQMKYSFASAVGLFNNVVGLVILLFFNTLSRRLADTSLW
ncbi:MAG: sugar ABC transporter permease [Clostridia bacterium]|nr:sugar ABC transporter permease [Clostridia bacterium]MBO4885593.1 sugar ABC transporter permease [Clostridia bacterium]MBR4441883.1 sugar ABC transporter permease [Clostridia bacterium]